MAIAALTHTYTQAGTATTPDIDTTGASLLVAVLVEQNTSSTITDNKGNVWTTLTRQDSNASCMIAYMPNPAVGTGHHWTTNGSFYAMGVAAFSGAALVSPFDQQNSFGKATNTVIQAGSITPTQDNELVIAAFATQAGSGTISINGGYTILDAQLLIGGTAFGFGLAYLIQTTATATNPTWTTVNATNTACIASFKAAAAGGLPFFMQDANMMIGDFHALSGNFQ